MISICVSAFVEVVLGSPPFCCRHVRDWECVVCADQRGFVWRNGTRYFWKRWRCVCVNCGFLIGGSGFAITASLYRFQYTKTWNCIRA